MAGPDDLLVRFARAIATTPPTNALSERLCLASRNLAGADAAALTVAYAETNRVTLFATDTLSARLEDLQEVMGEGPGYSAASNGQLEVCRLGTLAAERWPLFSAAALQLVGAATLHAVPMQPGHQLIGVMTLYQLQHPDTDLAMDVPTLERLAAATGAALMRDPEAVDQDLMDGPWQSRAQIHQATGMVVAQLGLNSDDALAVLKAHAYAGETTLADIAEQVVHRTIHFFNSPDDDNPPRQRGR
jgi:hypothetical protein